jgi:hypothetical protein
MNVRTLGAIALMVGLNMVTPSLNAHCDTMNGPVVAAARQALKSGDLTPALKWIPQALEAELGAAFARTLQVRAAGPAARELADTYFFETLVRLHRAGEGEPYTGLKPATEVDPAVAAADQALQRGSPDALVRAVAEKVGGEIRQRFESVSRARKAAGQSGEAGRQYVAAYVGLMHYLEQVDQADSGHPEEQHK